MAKKDEDRRRYPRSRRPGAVAIRDKSSPGLLNHVDNISCNGVLCHTVRPVAEMTKVNMALELPKPFERRIDATGVVVRCDEDHQGNDNYKVAILFTKLADEDHDAINEYVEHDIAHATSAE